MSPAKQQDRFDAFLEEDRKKGFDLAQAPLMRVALIRTADDVYRFVWSHHHILIDGWSSSLLLKEVFTYYQAYRQGRDLYLPRPRPYRDYIAWSGEQDLAKAETFWNERLDGFLSTTSLGIDRPVVGEHLVLELRGPHEPTLAGILDQCVILGPWAERVVVHVLFAVEEQVASL